MHYLPNQLVEKTNLNVLGLNGGVLPAFFTGTARFLLISYMNSLCTYPDTWDPTTRKKPTTILPKHSLEPK